MLRNHFEILKCAFGKYSSVGKEEIEILLPIVREVSLKKGAFFCRVGQCTQSEIIIGQGLLKLCLDNPKPFCHSYHFGDDIVTPLHARSFEGRSSWDIQAVKDATLLIFDALEFEKMRLAHKNWMVFGEQFMQDYFKESNRMDYFRNAYTPEEKYRYFVENKKQMLAELTQVELASYLGINPVSLSRIRSRI